MDYLQKFLREFGPLGVATISLEYARTGDERCAKEVRCILEREGWPRLEETTSKALGEAKSKLDTPHLLIATMASWCDELDKCPKEIERKLACSWLDGDDVQRLAARYYTYAMIYANEVDALLLARGVDLLTIQRECGVRLLHQHDKLALAGIYGNELLADYYLAKITPATPPTMPTPTNDDAPDADRVIDEEALRACFTATFGGRNKAGVDYVAECLMPDVRKKRDGKYYAKLALLTYNSPNLLKSARPATWKAWYREFARMAGVAVVESYRRSMVEKDISDADKRAYYYLTDKIE